jgi:hypothetical protein
MMRRSAKLRLLCRALPGCLLVFGMLLTLLSACAPAAPTNAPAAAEPTSAPAAKPQASAPSVPTATPAQSAAMTSAPAETVATAVPTQVIEGRQVELEWPERLRMGDSDMIRLALVPTKSGYVAHAEFPDHTVQSKEVPVPRPNGYVLYAVARLDGVGFDISPTGENERFVPAGEEVSWRWTLSPRKPGQHRLSVLLRLRWVPGPGVGGAPIESQAYSRGLDVQVSSFLGMSPAQAAATGLLGLILGGGLLLAAAVGTGWRGSRLVAVPRGALEPIEPSSGLAIETPAGMSLLPVESGLLRGLFRSYARLVIENEFLSGYSGARTFLVRPIRPDGCADAPTIVKLGPTEAIRQEFENYESFVKDRLPPMTARIQRAPVVLAGAKQSGSNRNEVRERAAVQYTFIAEPGRPPVSLRQALLQDPDPNYLLRLFETFGPGWWMQRRPYTFRLGVEYDRLLPPHYVLEPVAETGVRAALPLLMETVDPGCLGLAAGVLVHMQPFRQVERRADGRSFSLVGTPAEGRTALRLRWSAPVLPGGAALARVVATRMDLLHDWTASFDRFGLPDPFERLPAVLDETIAGTRSVIHGDLNLENVLVGPGSLVWLIDFAQTREGHPLFDFAHLGSEMIAHVLAVRAGSPRTYLDLWQAGRDPLLEALEHVAGRCLFDPARPREYHLALYLACLGALKYQNLSGLAKHCLYLTAALVCDQALFAKPNLRKDT